MVSVSHNKVLSGVQAGYVYDNQGTAPYGYRPSEVYDSETGGVWQSGVRIVGTSISGYFWVNIHSDGKIDIVSDGTHSQANSYVFSASYVTEDTFPIT